MKKLLSLPPNLVSSFHEIEQVSPDEYFCTSDPIGARLGSGGGTAWLLHSCWQAESNKPFDEWLAQEKRILLHAGGQSRRLPSYAPSGKVLTPIPVFRWARGQRLSQNLLQLQLPLYERIMQMAPRGLHTLIASGDVLVRCGKLQEIPDADVVCYGLWVDASLARNHGVFVSRRETPDRLDFMLQKPSLETLGQLVHTHLYLMDVGIWLLSDRAVEVLLKRSAEVENGKWLNGKCYDLYSDFGQSLGEHPTLCDPELAGLSVAILPLQDGEFYHYGTSRELISSTVAIQNLIYDQRAIMHLGMKPHPSIFIQNAHSEFPFSDANQNIWIENSHVGVGWQLTRNHIITGVPANDWQVRLPEGACVDVVPIGERAYALRPYWFDDTFAGQRQFEALFPVSEDLDELGRLLPWMLSDRPDGEMQALWQRLPRLSASDLSDQANLLRLHEQRLLLRRDNLPALARNHRRSVFYQTNLDAMAHEYYRFGLPLPPDLPESEPLLKRISDQMFRRQALNLRGEDGSPYEARAFALLREGLTQQAIDHRQQPHLSVCADQIVWGRSPVRIDIAGGWTDTPPYCLTHGGNVVNLAIELNGQPPLQTFIKPCREPRIVLRSIDLGASEVITTYDQLQDFARVGSPFSIPKAALCLAGFLPRFSVAEYPSLEAQLRDFGCGIELTLLSAIPAGSGLGTSSILAANVLGTISDFCGLSWDKAEICRRTLILEQLLTTGGGWQDQYGGVLGGVKLLQSEPGLEQNLQVRWLPDTLFTDPQYAPCHLLYYTGITRTAKEILAEIVRGMFLSDTRRLSLLGEMRDHALELYDAIQQGDFHRMGLLIGKTWQQNQALDSGTNPPAVQSVVSQIEDLCLGLKLPGAGGGGFLYMVAKDPDAALRIRQTLTAHPANPRARFVEMTLSQTGQQISRS
ncbi:MAG: bifunctional fucokinase/L-fucose-1-P-guanylyltransferase [Bacteroidaceae bacterium]|nr:bifunctional fucokinase/L-fucose-1-P-guanylyltransferase [Bacteroidaceae bacterium]